MKPRLTLIAAVAKNGVIGSNNAIPWKLPEDLKRFKALTMGHPIIMGRKTWTSLGRPLPGRRNLVISRDPAYSAPGAELFSSLAAALAACATVDEVFVIGGAEIYTLALPLADRLQITEVQREFQGDTRFPAIDPQIWREISREHHTATEFDYAFVTYEHI